MSDLAIQVDNIGKLYRLGEVGTGTISHDLNRWAAKVRGKDDPFAKIGETNDRTVKGESDYVWALKDVSFEVKEGEVLGIIGRNGAGKSTLLKILSKVTTPTTGEMRIKGRIASLLEVGTGFHPELTGKENIFLNGSILGMTKVEIRKKFDEIVDFSGVERYIDTPVKRYSSGMYVRLAFAVAAHLETDVLIIDEVLAVGDAEFQKKCLGKMSEVSKREGRTVLFVSHSIPAIKRLCSKSILLNKGSLFANGSTEKVVDIYLKEDFEEKPTIKKFSLENAPGNNYLKILEVALADINNEYLSTINTETEIFVLFKCVVSEKDKRVGFTMILKDNNDFIVFSSISNSDRNFLKNRSKGEIFNVSCKIDKNFLNDETYKISLIVFEKTFENPCLVEDLLTFSVEDGATGRGDFNGKFAGIVRPQLLWEST